MPMPEKIRQFFGLDSNSSPKKAADLVACGGYTPVRNVYILPVCLNQSWPSVDHFIANFPRQFANFEYTYGM